MKPVLLHLTAGAREREELVRDDRDRRELLRRLADTHGAGFLAYCLMDTHLHVVVEGEPESVARLAVALHAYTQAFNLRHERRGTLLRGPVHATPITDLEALAMAIRYLHENPVRTRTPIVQHAYEYEWSSARAYVDLTAAPVANVARARELLGPLARRLGPPGPPLATVATRPIPAASPDLLLSAAAQTFGVTPDELKSLSRDSEVVRARALYVSLGELESYTHEQLGPTLARTRSSISTIATSATPAAHVRIARTLLEDPGLARRLGAQG